MDRWSIDDCFKSRGIFISPIEIEEVLRKITRLQSMHVPHPDKEIGNKIRAILVLRSGIAGSDDFVNELKDDLRASIAPYKVPHMIEFLDVLPKSAVGKVLRRSLIKKDRKNQ